MNVQRRSRLTETFNNKLCDMLDGLASSFPAVPQFALAVTATRIGIIGLPAQPQLMFDKYVAIPYEARIMARDEAFFIAHSAYGDDLNADVTTIDLVSVIKGVWKDATPEDHVQIWRHLNLLVELNRLLR